MRKLLLLLSVLFLWPALSLAQNTTVTGTVVDQFGNPYAGGTVAFSLSYPTGTTPIYTGTGQRVSTASGPWPLNNSGSFTVPNTGPGAIADNTQVSPAGTKWIITVCGNSIPWPGVLTQRICFTTTPQTIFGGSADISSTLNSIAPYLAYTPGAGSAFKVNGVTVLSPNLTDSASVTFHAAGSIITATAVGACAIGSNSQVFYNSGGVCAAAANLTYTPTTTTVANNFVATTGQNILNAYSFNSRVYVDANKYGCSSAGLNAAIAAAEALMNQGGEVDATGCQGTGTISESVVIGAVNKPVRLFVSNSTNWNCTITNNTTCWILEPSSSLLGIGATQTPGGVGGFTMADSASVNHELALVDQGGSNAGFDIENITLQPNASATFSSAALYMLNPLQIGEMRNVTVAALKANPLMEITETAMGGGAGPLNLYNIQLDCQNLTGCKPYLEQGVSGGGVMAGINFYGGVLAHPGSDTHIIADLESASMGNDCAGTNFYGTQLESSNSNDIGILINGCTAVRIDGVVASAVTPGVAVVRITGATTDGVVIHDLNNFDLWTNNVQNAINGINYPATNNRMNYSYFSPFRVNTTVIDDGSGNQMTVDSNGVTTPRLNTNNFTLGPNPAGTATLSVVQNVNNIYGGGANASFFTLVNNSTGSSAGDAIIFKGNGNTSVAAIQAKSGSGATDVGCIGWIAGGQGNSSDLNGLQLKQCATTLTESAATTISNTLTVTGTLNNVTLAGTGVACIQADASGNLTPVSPRAACGSGGGGGSGTVTSVGLTQTGSIFTITGSPVTTSGNLNLAFAAEAANTVFANCTGGSTSPTFCSITAAMEPATTVNSVVNDTNVTGTISAQALTLGWTGTLGITRGGTGAGNQQGALNDIACAPNRAGDLMYYNGSNWVCVAGNNSSTQYLQETSSGVPSWTVPSGSGTVTHTAGALTANAVVIGNSSADITVLASLGTTTTLLHGNAGGPPSFGAVVLTTDVSGILPVPNGGTGVGTFTGIAKGNGTSVFTAAASADVIALWSGTCSSSTFLRGDGACAAAGGTGTVTSVAQTFTGGLISVGGSPITTNGTLALTVAGNSGGIPYFSSSSTWASSASLTQYGIVYGGGAAAAPVVVTPPTVNGNYLCGYSVVASAAVAPTCSLSGVPVIPETGSSDTLLYSYRASLLNISGGSTFGLTLPTAATNLASNLPFVVYNGNSGNVTVTPTTPNNINMGTSQAALTLLPKMADFIYQDSAATINWHDLGGGLMTFASMGSNCGDSTHALSWSTTTGIGCQTLSGGGGSGTVSAQVQYTVAVYTAAGTSTTLGLNGLSTDSTNNFHITGQYMDVNGGVAAYGGTIGTGFTMAGVEGTAPSCKAAWDLLWFDSTAHREKVCDNNGSAVQLVHSGADINTSDQVTVTHLSSALPVAQGGTGQTSGTVTFTVANGTSSLGTSAIGSGACATVVTTTATGTATTDNIMADFNADPTGVTGYAPLSTGMLTIIKYPTSNNVNFKVCNNTASSITPGAITLNWRVVR